MSSERVLVVRFSAIGDCVLAAWPATALRRCRPTVHIGWAVDSRCADVLASPDLVDDVHPMPRGEWKRRGSVRSLPAVLRAYMSLRPYRYDVGVDLQGHTKTALCLRLSGARVRWGVRPTDAFAAGLNRRLGISAHGAHELDLYRAVADALGWGPLPDRPLMPNVEFEERDRPLATIQTGAGFPDKRYPITHWREVARGLAARGFEVWALGGPGDPRLGIPEATDRVGELSLSEALAAIAGSAVHLAGDTGTGHAAAAYGVPVVSAFGPSDPARFRPWSERAVVLREAQETGAVSPDAVLAAVLKLVEGRGVAFPR